jgi:uncharacterized membrane protein YphA (DoxX/SURF4 family)
VLARLFYTDPDRIETLIRITLCVIFFALVNGRYGLFLNWFGDRKGHGCEYHLLVIALAAVIVVRGSGAVSLDRLLYTSIN